MKWRIGAVTVTKIVELEVTGGSRFLLPQATYEEILPIEWLQPDFADDRGRLKMSIHALVVETPSPAHHRRHLPRQRQGEPPHPDLEPHADQFPRRPRRGRLCPRNDRHGRCAPISMSTMSAGTQCWLMASWVPTFPKARYLMGRVEYQHWTTQHERDDMKAVLADSVAPVFDAGLVDLVETDHRVCDEISLVPTPGHTPGHVSVRIASGGEEALITGDFMHHPCQIARPDWSSTADSDPAVARQTRERMLTHLADAPILVIGTHFAGRTAGRVVPDGDAFRLAV